MKVGLYLYYNGSIDAFKINETRITPQVREVLERNDADLIILSGREIQKLYEFVKNSKYTDDVIRIRSPRRDYR